MVAGLTLPPSPPPPPQQQSSKSSPPASVPGPTSQGAAYASYEATANPTGSYGYQPGASRQSATLSSSDNAALTRVAQSVNANPSLQANPGLASLAASQIVSNAEKSPTVAAEITGNEEQQQAAQAQAAAILQAATQRNPYLLNQYPNLPGGRSGPPTPEAQLEALQRVIAAVEANPSLRSLYPQLAALADQYQQNPTQASQSLLQSFTNASYQPTQIPLGGYGSATVNLPQIGPVDLIYNNQTGSYLFANNKRTFQYQKGPYILTAQISPSNQITVSQQANPNALLAPYSELQIGRVLLQNNTGQPVTLSNATATQTVSLPAYSETLPQGNVVIGNPSGRQISQEIPVNLFPSNQTQNQQLYFNQLQQPVTSRALLQANKIGSEIINATESNPVTNFLLAQPALGLASSSNTFESSYSTPGQKAAAGIEFAAIPVIAGLEGAAIGSGIGTGYGVATGALPLSAAALNALNAGLTGAAVSAPITVGISNLLSVLNGNGILTAGQDVSSAKTGALYGGLLNAALGAGAIPADTQVESVPPETVEALQEAGLTTPDEIYEARLSNPELFKSPPPPPPEPKFGFVGRTTNTPIASNVAEALEKSGLRTPEDIDEARLSNPELFPQAKSVSLKLTPNVELPLISKVIDSAGTNYKLGKDVFTDPEAIKVSLAEAGVNNANLIDSATARAIYQKALGRIPEAGDVSSLYNGFLKQFLGTKLNIPISDLHDLKLPNLNDAQNAALEDTLTDYATLPVPKTLELSAALENEGITTAREIREFALSNPDDFYFPKKANVEVYGTASVQEILGGLFRAPGDVDIVFRIGNNLMKLNLAKELADNLNNADPAQAGRFEVNSANPDVVQDTYNQEAGLPSKVLDSHIQGEEGSAPSKPLGFSPDSAIRTTTDGQPSYDLATLRNTILGKGNSALTIREAEGGGTTLAAQEARATDEKSDLSDMIAIMQRVYEQNADIVGLNLLNQRVAQAVRLGLTTPDQIAKSLNAIDTGQLKIQLPISQAEQVAATTQPYQAFESLTYNQQSPSLSVSPSLSISPSASLAQSPSISLSTSPSTSPSVSASPSISSSLSPSPSLSTYLSPSPSPSPSISLSLSPYLSPSPSPSPSISPSPSPSVSTSPSPSPSPSISLSPSPLKKLLPLPLAVSSYNNSTQSAKAPVPLPDQYGIYQPDVDVALFPNLNSLSTGLTTDSPLLGIAIRPEQQYLAKQPPKLPKEEPIEASIRV